MLAQRRGISHAPASGFAPPRAPAAQQQFDFHDPGPRPLTPPPRGRRRQACDRAGRPWPLRGLAEARSEEKVLPR